MAREPRVIVIGGGAIGVCIAYYLAREGADVVLLEQGEVGGGCSQGNAGQITPGHLPLPQPGTMWRNLRWLVRPDSPLYIKPSFLAEHMSWFMQFSRACTHRHMAQATGVLCRLGRLSFRLFHELARKADFGFRVQGRLEICADEETLTGAEHEAAILQRYGFSYEKLDADEVRTRVPMLRGSVRGAIYYPESAHCDPAAFVRAVAELARSEGAQIETGTVVRTLDIAHEQVRAVVTDRGDYQGEHVILATGAWTPELVRPLGLDLPILPGKGYHVDYRAVPGLPQRPVVLVKDRVFVTPLGTRCRFAGTMEFSGFNRDIDQRRVKLIEEAAGRAFDLSGTEPVDVWCHMRPMSADGLPYIGPVPWVQNLWVAAGHGMLGLTQGPATGLLIAQWILSGVPEMDLSPLRPDRYAHGAFHAAVTRL